MRRKVKGSRQKHEHSGARPAFPSESPQSCPVRVPVKLPILRLRLLPNLRCTRCGRLGYCEQKTTMLGYCQNIFFFFFFFFFFFEDNDVVFPSHSRNFTLGFVKERSKWKRSCGCRWR